MKVTTKDTTPAALDEATSEEFDAFEALARRLVKVPKAELDKAVSAAKNGH